MIALALAKDPELLVADEPTTALDVTVQAEIIALLRRLCNERHFGVLLVTHDLGVAGELADRCLVMFKGRVIETGSVDELATDPKHPYTSTLVSAVPQNEGGRPILEPPSTAVGADGRADHDVDVEIDVDVDVDVEAERATTGACAYRARCPFAIDVCFTVEPPVDPVEPVEPVDGPAASERAVACHRAHELELPGAKVAVASEEGGPS